MAIASSHANLRISSQHHSVAELTEVLGIEPTMAVDRADLGAGRHQATDWILQAPVHEHRTTSEHLAWLVDFVGARPDAFRDIRQTASVELSCMCEQLGDEGGWSVPADVLARAGQQGLDVTFSIYPVGDAEI